MPRLLSRCGLMLGCAGGGGAAATAAHLMLPPLVASPHQIVNGDAEVIRQLPGVFQVGEVNTTLKFLVVLLNNPNRLSYLNLCLFFLLAQFRPIIFYGLTLLRFCLATLYRFL